MARYTNLSKRINKLKMLTLDNINQSLVKMPLSVKSKVYLRFMQHKEEMKRGVEKPFQKLLSANTGDTQSYGQPPITFLRQVLALCLHPRLCNDPEINVPDDVKKRVNQLTSQFPHKSIGSLTDPQGLMTVRRHVAQYIVDRDCGGVSSPDNIFVHDTCSCLNAVFSMVSDHLSPDPVGILLPIPCYPMFTALANIYGIQIIPYYLDENNDWNLDVRGLKSAVEEAKQSCRPKGIVVINPGNPTGQVLNEENMQDIISFCYHQQLFIIADEVYQNNIHDPKIKFISFKKVKRKMRKPFSSVELVSVNSASKGYIGECGLRGGYVEFDGFDAEIEQAFRNALSMHNCGNVAGQIAMDVTARPPRENEPSYEQFEYEKTYILTEMAQKATVLVERLNEIEGISVKQLRGGLFAYAGIQNMPCEAIKEAESLGLKPSLFWTIQLLDKTGIALVPGSSFFEKPGTHHFRVTLAPPIEVIEQVTEGIKCFHEQFLQTYKSV